MEITNVKERFESIGTKTKLLLFLGMTLILMLLIPKEIILPLGIVALLLVFSKRIGLTFYFFSKTIFNFVFTIILLLFFVYFGMLAVVYFFT